MRQAAPGPSRTTSSCSPTSARLFASPTRSAERLAHLEQLGAGKERRRGRRQRRGRRGAPRANEFEVPARALQRLHALVGADAAVHRVAARRGAERLQRGEAFPQRRRRRRRRGRASGRGWRCAPWWPRCARCRRAEGGLAVRRVRQLEEQEAAALHGSHHHVVAASAVAVGAGSHIHPPAAAVGYCPGEP